MPNMDGSYTLTEVAQKYEVSASWINKIQRETEILKSNPTPGTRSELTDSEVKTIGEVLALTKLNFSLKDIDSIYTILEEDEEAKMQFLRDEIHKRTEFWSNLIEEFIIDRFLKED